MTTKSKKNKITKSVKSKELKRNMIERHKAGLIREEINELRLISSYTLK